MKYKYWLANIKGISNGKINLLLEKFLSAEHIYHMDSRQYEKIKGLTAEDIINIEESKRNRNLEKEWSRFEETGAGFVTIEDDGYPRRLRNISNPPYALYFFGNLPREEETSIAIVGARGRSAYGGSVARQLSETLARNNINVISGLARGIDADAHAGTIIGGGKTFAVLACGVDVIYPRENKYLYEEILASGGGILSEYPMGTKPMKNLFPSRNRIISGLSDGVCVVEARKRSGSLITADFAMEQGKEVYAVPGRITEELSEGCNSLIFQGAIPVVTIPDFLTDVLGIKKVEEAQIHFSNFLLEKDEALVYSLLDFQPVGMEELISKTPLDIVGLSDVLETLEQKGFVKEVIPGCYVRMI